MSTSWVSKSSTGFTARWEFESTVINGIIYCFGGESAGANSSPVSSLQSYNPSTDSWTTLSPTGSPVFTYRSGVDNINGIMYIAAGSNGSSKPSQTLAYNPSTNTYTQEAACTANDSVTAANVNGYLLMYGSWGISTAFYKYDPVANLWSSLTASTSGGYCRSIGSGNTFYVITGVNSSAIPITFSLSYNLSSNTWTILNYYVTSGPGAFAIAVEPLLVLYNNEIYFFGGSTSTSGGSGLTHNLVYSIAQNQWSSLETTGFTAITCAGGGVYNEIAYVIGGYNGSPSTINQSLNLASVIISPFYSFTPPTWTTRFQTLGIQNTGLIYVIGGETSEIGFTPQSINQVYNPIANIWTTLASMTNARHKLFGDVSNGVIYAIGGYGYPGPSYNGFNEGYSIASNSWTTLASQSTGTEESTANTVNGIIYCAGGYNSSSNPAVNLNQGYNISLNQWSLYGVSGFTPVSYAAEGTIDNNLIVYGGFDNNLNILDLCQDYNAVQNSWSQKTTLGLTPSALSLAAVSNGQLYAFGGSVTPGQINQYTPTSSVSSYSPGANAWQVLDNGGFIPVAAGGIGVVSGSMYLIGGAVSTASISPNIQVYTPSNPLPTIPVLVSPTNGSQVTETSQVLQWSSSSNANGYNYQVSTGSSFSTIFASGNTQTLLASVSGLSYGTTYYWEVQASGSSGLSSWSSYWDFSVVLGIPVLTAPGNGSQSTSLPIDLQWQSVTGASSYNVQVATDALFNNIIININVSTTNYSTSVFSTDTTYYWRVQAVSGSSTSSWSSTWSFSYTQLVAQGAPTLISPYNGITFLSSTPSDVSFLWDGNYKGNWTGSTIYHQGDIVSYSGSLYNANSDPQMYNYGLVTNDIGNTGPYNGFYTYSNRAWSITGSTDPSKFIVNIPHAAYGEQIDYTRSDGVKGSIYGYYNLGYGGVGPATLTFTNPDPSYTYTFTLKGADNVWYWAWWWANSIQVSWPSPNFLPPPQDPSWKLVVSGFENYEFQLAFDNLFNSKLVDTTLYDTTITESSLDLGRYFWRVRYVLTTGYSQWTPTWYFTIQAPPPPPPPVPPPVPLIKNLPPDFRPDALIKYIVIHHTETDLSTSLDDINQQAILDQYFGAPYDIIIDKNGKIAITPQWINASTSNQIIKGASINDILKYTLHQPCQDMEVASLIMTSINIAVIGDFNRISPLPIQGAILQQILTALQGKYDISGVYYHRDVSATSCPGNNFFSKNFLNINDLGTDIFNQNSQPVVPIEAGFQIVNSRSNT